MQNPAGTLTFVSIGMMSVQWWLTFREWSSLLFYISTLCVVLLIQSARVHVLSAEKSWDLSVTCLRVSRPDFFFAIVWARDYLPDWHVMCNGKQKAWVSILGKCLQVWCQRPDVHFSTMSEIWSWPNHLTDFPPTWCYLCSSCVCSCCQTKLWTSCRVKGTFRFEVPRQIHIVV